MRQHFFRANLHEIRLLFLPQSQNIRCFNRSSFRQMFLNQPFQLIFPMARIHSRRHQRFTVQHMLKPPFRIVNIGHAARHSRAKVRTNWPKDHRNTTGHVFTPVGPATFDHHSRA